MARSNMRHMFSVAPSVTVGRSQFDRSHRHLTTFNGGFLVPVYVEEILPGDGMNLRMQGLLRLTTPRHPVMDNMRVSSFFFFVPIRLLWSNWERFNGAQDKPGDSTDFVCPTVTSPAGGYGEQSLEDYFGLPTKVAGIKHIAFFHRAYQLIWDDWFRHQDLQDSLSPPLGDGPDDPSLYKLLKRNKRYDYFTSCLPFPQKGPTVSFPFGGVVPVQGIGVQAAESPQAGTTVNESDPAKTATYASTFTTAANNLIFEGNPNNNNWMNVRVDLDQATQTTSVNEVRQAFQVQIVFEKDARGGTRYIELLKSHWGVTSPDHRHQRPEYLGGSTSPIIVTQVPQTSATDQAVSPQGNLAAYGTSNMDASRHGFTKSFTEHGLIIGMVSVQADLTYQQGLDRMWSRSTRFDYALPSFSHLGEQAVLRKEIFADGSGNDELVFGYIPRHDEYRYKRSSVTGLFRSNATQSLDVWHCSENFGSAPVLNAEFMEDKADITIDRVIAVQNQPQFLFDGYFSIKHARGLPVHSVPGLIDHF